MKGFKGFDKNMQCRGFQYEENKEFKEDVEPTLCNKGLHFCESPLDVWGYYPPNEENIFAEVEAKGKVKTEGDKSVTNHLKIGAKIGIAGLVKAHLELIFSKIVDTKTETNTGARSAATNMGARSAATNTGDYSAATNTGDEGIACALGIQSRARAEKGWIVVTDWRQDSSHDWHIHAIHTARVGKKIKGVLVEPNKQYWFKNGELKSEIVKI